MGMIVIIAAVGFAVWLLVQNREAGQRFCSTTEPARTETALEVLEKRYARGEIGHDEFEARKRDLR